MRTEPLVTEDSTDRRVTVHCMVRDEYPTVVYAVMSVLAHADKMLIVDTGSVDSTRQWLWDLSQRHPDKIDLEYRDDIPDSTDWRFHRYNMPNRRLSNLRLEMIDKTQTPFIWILDGDEVYRDITCQQVRELIDKWPDGKRAAYIPLLWFANDIYSLARTEPGTYPFTGRIFLSEGLRIHGAFPGEMHTYRGQDLGYRSPLTFDARWMEPFHHYEMVTKPWRRRLLGTVPYDGPQPEVFERLTSSNGKRKRRRA